MLFRSSHHHRHHRRHHNHHHTFLTAATAETATLHARSIGEMMGAVRWLGGTGQRCSPGEGSATEDLAAATARERRHQLATHYGNDNACYPDYIGPSGSGDVDGIAAVVMSGHGVVAQLRDRFAATLGDGEHAESVTVHVAGRVLSRRNASKHLAFLDVLADGGGRIQVVASMGRFADKDAYTIQLRQLRRGDVIEVEGHLGKTKIGELSVFAHTARLLSPCLHDLPSTLHDVETTTRHRHLHMLVNPELGATLRLRARVIQSMRAFFVDRGFVEVETPTLWSNVGGANARPFKTRSNALGQDLSLRIATEIFLKTLVVGGLDRVFEIGKQFRNEGIDATHNPEFTTCEAYMAYAGFDELLALTENLLRTILAESIGSTAVTVAGGCLSADSGSDDTEADADAGAGVVVDFGPAFRQISVVPALEEALGAALPDLEDGDAAVPVLLQMCAGAGVGTGPPHTVPALMDRLIGHVLEPMCIQPTFLCHHPLAMSPLAKADPTRPGLAARFELFVNGSELCNAYQELNDPDEQRARFQSQLEQREKGDDECPVPDEAFCAALEYGLPPTVGLGIGVDRLAMLLSGNRHIRDVLAFPLYRPRGDHGGGGGGGGDGAGGSGGEGKAS